MLQATYEEAFLAIGLVIAMLILMCCFLNAGLKKSGRKQREEHDTMPAYARKEYGRTASMKKQRRFYTSEEMKVQKKPISGVSRAIAEADDYLIRRSESQSTSRSRTSGSVLARRGGEFIGNRMRFKVKVLNETQFTITDVKVFLISFPSEALHLDSDDEDEFFPKIEPQGFRSPTFDFLPTQDCVKGEIIAGL